MHNSAMFDWSDLRFFLAVAREGSSLAAAKALRVTPDDLATLGLDLEDLQSPDFSACQRVGAHAAFLEYDALIVPSVRADGTNVVIFVNELAADAAFERVEVEQIP